MYQFTKNQETADSFLRSPDDIKKIEKLNFRQIFILFNSKITF